MNLSTLIEQLKQMLVTLGILNAMEDKNMLDKMCLAIRDFEGVPGNANYINNNPGNARYYSGGYLSEYQPVKESSSGFAIFPSMDVGMLYLHNLIKEKINNHLTWSLLEFMENYAPYSDGNNSFVYASFIAKRLGVEVSYPVKEILS